MESRFYAQEGTFVPCPFLYFTIEALLPVGAMDISLGSHIVREVGEVVLDPFPMRNFREEGVMAPHSGRQRP